MAGDAYRDSASALRAQLRSLERDLVEREAHFTKLFWKNLPSDLASPYETLRPRCAAHDDSVASLATARDACAGCLRLLDAAVAALPEMEAEWSTPLPLAPAPRLLTAGRVRLGLGAGTLKAHADCLLAVALQRDPTAVARSLSSLATEVRARVGRAPLRLVVETPMHAFPRSSGEPDVVVHATTSMCRAVSSMRLRPEGWLDGFLKAVRLTRDVSLHDDVLDHYFLVDGEEAAVKSTITAEVREALRVICREDVPQLTIAPGSAVLSWNYEPVAATVEAAIDALVAIHRAPPTLRFRRA